MSNSIDQLAEGGRGIKLMWQIADEVSYTRSLDGRNCLSLSKTYEVEGRDRSQNIKKATALDGLINLLKRWDWQDDIEQEAELNENSCKNISLQVNTDLNALTRVLDGLEQLQDVSIPKEVWFQFQLALAEGFTNAVRHAHKNLAADTPIQLQITLFSGHWQFKIWDWGPRFDFDAKLQEIIATDRKRFADLEVLSDTSLIPGRPTTLEMSQFRIAG